MRKRATIEERMAKLRGEIEGLVVGPSSSQVRRMLAGKRAALHVMEKAKERGDTDYCKGPEPTAAERVRRVHRTKETIINETGAV